LVKDLRVVFGLSNSELNAHLVRLSVLYEDLKIELTARVEDDHMIETLRPYRADEAFDDPVLPPEFGVESAVVGDAIPLRTLKESQDLNGDLHDQ
jgi:hypothetical protein